MKTLAIFLILALTSHFTYAGNQLQGDAVRQHVERIFGDKIKKSLEEFKKVMKTGNEAAGLPKLEPFNLDYDEFKFNEKFIIAEGNVSNLFVEGLSNYAVQYANYELFGSTVNIDMVWSNIKGHTSYNVNGKVLDKYPIYGAGNASYELENFRFTTDMKVSYSIGSKKVSIIGFSNTKISLEKLTHFEITGLYNNEELSQELGSIISEMAPQTIADFHEEITNQLNIILLKVSQEVLEKIDIWEFIHL